MAGVVPIEHLGRPNFDRPQAGIRGGPNLDFRGWSGESRRIRTGFRATRKRPFSNREGIALKQDSRFGRGSSPGRRRGGWRSHR
jgi:hypothetical protein